MFIKTQAYKELQIARENVQSAIKALSKIVIDQCDGSLEFSKSGKLMIRSALSELISVRQELEK